MFHSVEKLARHADARPMTARMIDGKAQAELLVERVGQRVAAIVAAGGRAPGLAVVLVGDDAASHVYVRNKLRQSGRAGIQSFEHRVPATVTEAALLELVARLNADECVDGILVQLPLPDHIDTTAILIAVDPTKDVDGFHPINAGRLATGQPGLVPCTPRACMHLLRTLGTELAGLHAVVVGRSNIVGKPLAQLLLRADCTVTVAHSRTRDLPTLCRTADILIAAIGRPRHIGAGYVQPGAIVLDVGTNRGPDGRLIGDVAFDEVKEIARAITPVPGGVGPMTVACLLENTLAAHQARA